ncbi:MAG: hypothetical protein FD180_3831 [Planctomycetota bacterium]|nr:MAG: hypothetical protein FD180_3831 [Planctomycetota bacterium]
MNDVYGSASDIPSVLARVSDGDPERQAQARSELAARLWCGGMLTPASVAATGPLLDLAADPSVPGRIQLLITLQRIAGALGGDEEGEACVELLGHARWKHYYDYYGGAAASYGAEASEVIAGKLDLVLKLLREEDAGVRTHAALLMPVTGSVSMDATTCVLAALQAERVPLAASAQCLALSAFPGDATLNALNSRIGPDHPDLVRRSAAMALAALMGPKTPAVAAALLDPLAPDALRIVEWLASIPVDTNGLLPFLDASLEALHGEAPPRAPGSGPRLGCGWYEHTSGNPEAAEDSPAEEAVGTEEEEEDEDVPLAEDSFVSEWLLPLQLALQKEILDHFKGRRIPSTPALLDSGQLSILQLLSRCRPAWHGPAELEEFLRQLNLPDQRIRLVEWLEERE